MRENLVALLGRAAALPFALTRPRAPLADPRAIVVIKPCCLGDVLMATAVVGQLRRAYPRARLAFAVGDWSHAAIEGNPLVDEIIPCGPVAAGVAYGLRDYLALVGRLRRGEFDLAVVLERSVVMTLLPLLAGIPYRAGIDSGGRGFSLTAKAPWDGPRHEAELYLDTLRALGLAVEAPHLEFYPSPGDVRAAMQALRVAESLRDGRGQRLVVADPRPRVAIHAGGGANPGMVLAAKQWPARRFSQLARRLLTSGARVVLVGAAADRRASDQVLATLHEQRAGIIDLTGATTFGQLGAVLANCDLFVGNDSGPMHLAVAVGTRVVGLFGPSSPTLYGPFDPRSIALYQPLECSPCFVNGDFARECVDYRCQRAISVDDVWQAVTSLLSLSQSAPPSDAYGRRA